MSKPIASYSPFRRAGDTVYCSGQIPLIPETGELFHGTITEEVNRAIDNLAAVLEQAGSGLDQAVKTTVFLKDLADFQAMNEVYATYFTDAPPARATVEVARLPKDVRVEIECIAVAGGS